MSVNDDLLREITRCPVLVDAKSGTRNACSAVVAVQQSAASADHQVPEPWTGHLDRARILFVSSNPSIADDDLYPNWSWDDGDVRDFFTERFGPGPSQIKDGVYAPLADGRGHRDRVVRFWSSVRARAREVLDDPVPGEDYALTEVVHCKSRSEIGVREAMDECPDRYLGRVLDVAANARLVVVVGKWAALGVGRALELGIDPQHRVHHLTHAHGNRYLVYLDHFQGGGKVKRLAVALAPDTLSMIRSSMT